jgi:O-antigen/teichoic acid export membrane protein
MSDRKKFLKGITSGYAYMAFSMIVALCMVPYVLKFLTKSEYGIFAIAGDLLGWLSVANLGVTSAFNSKSGHLLGRNNLYELNVLTNTTFFTQLASSILIAIIGAVVVNNPSIVFGNEDIYENINVVLLFMVIGFFIQYITQPLNSLLVADKQVHIDNYLRFGLLAIQTVLNIVLLNFGFKLMSLAISSLTSNIIISAITWVRIKKSFPSIKLETKYFQKDELRNLLKHGIWFSIGGIAGILILRMDTFLIGKYISLALVASFTINIKLYQLADKLFGQVFNTMRPYFAQTFGRNDLTRLKYYYDMSNSVALVLSIAIGTVSYTHLTLPTSP